MTVSAFDLASERLLRSRTADGFGPTPGADPDPEPTALAAIALDDSAARDWLLGAQRPDGSFGIRSADVDSDAATAVCALALPPGPERERALDHIIGQRAYVVPLENAPRNIDLVSGWAWTAGTAGWVEPTARALLALRRLRPMATQAIGDGIVYLMDRECVGGGWNAGNRMGHEIALPPYGHTTALALVALHGSAPFGAVVERGVDALRGLWPVERGVLTLATSLAAFRLLGLPDAQPVEVELGEALERDPLNDVVALAWAVIATGPNLDALRVSP